MAIYNKYTLWCDDCDAARHTDFKPESDGPPTVCPFNATHTNIRDITIEASFSTDPASVKVIDTQGLDPNTATSCTEFIEVQVTSGESVSEGIISYPFPVDVAAARYVMEDSRYEYGDKFDVFGIADGDPAIGGVTAPAAQGATSVHVSPTVFQYSKPGLYLKFQGHADEYRIESMNAVAGTVELMAPLEAAVGAGETIHVRRPFLINGWVVKNLVYAIGDLTSGSSELNAHDSIRIRYYHKTTPNTTYVLPFALAMLF
jgi:hypothetical protein